jgi:hypothetical protein
MKEGRLQNCPTAERLLMHSPLVVRKRGQTVGHVVLLVGFSDRNWYSIDPQVINTGPSTSHTFGAHSFDGQANTEVTPSGVHVRDNQPSWHAGLRHDAKNKLFEVLKPEFFYYEARKK